MEASTQDSANDFLQVEITITKWEDIETQLFEQEQSKITPSKTPSRDLIESSYDRKPVLLLDKDTTTMFATRDESSDDLSEDLEDP